MYMFKYKNNHNLNFSLLGIKNRLYKIQSYMSSMYMEK